MIWTFLVLKKALYLSRENFGETFSLFIAAHVLRPTISVTNLSPGFYGLVVRVLTSKLAKTRTVSPGSLYEAKNDRSGCVLARTVVFV